MKRSKNIKGRIKSLRSFTKTVQVEFNDMATKGKSCAKCARPYERMECSHVLSIGAYPNLRFDIINVLPLCSRDHIWWWHDVPTESGEWFRKKFPQRWVYLEKAKLIPRRFRLEDLEQLREWIKNKEVDKLHFSIEELKKYET